MYTHTHTCARIYAHLQGCTAIICMPVNTPEIKVANVRKLGGQVVLVGESYQEAQAAAPKARGRGGCMHRLVVLRLQLDASPATAQGERFE